MPGFYPEDEYDLAGFAVGIVDKAKIINRNTMAEGDVVIALPSSGVHSNGFSLVRKVFDVDSPEFLTPRPELGGASLGQTLLTPTKIYVKPMLALIDIRIERASATSPAAAFTRTCPEPFPDGPGSKKSRKIPCASPPFSP